MNYIKHLNAAFHRCYADDRLRPGHVSLYMALFFYWNLHRFAEVFYANRTEIMKMAKIGSRSTYHRLIKELSEWEYIEYLPTQSPARKTMVRLYHFRTTDSTVTGPTGTLMQRYCPKNVPPTLYTKQNKQYKLSEERKPKNEIEVIDFFKRKNWPSLDAKKFYNHYQGVGWKVGKAPIADWRAIAGNWMLKADEIKKTAAMKTVAKNGDHLMTQNQKDYDEPL
ncbi:hypothetical protein RQM65_06745 [Pricia sp. S334]|uniref:Transcriptional regulator n=1 Tax=Pricia mediterranea TaxID=3076079 RepID=A0ABU3L3N4_9FLAO|nr:hypothetical protein [Pricia sp. S334]MDT7828356.1 hypothetical protein [Pricia sp. S334]